MILSDEQWEENYLEYLRLLKDSNYHDVIFDEESGGVSAICYGHSYDNEMGPWGYKRGEYEIQALSVLRNNGACIVLIPDAPNHSMYKQYDGLCNGLKTEIKTIENTGHWAVRRKLYYSAMQGAECVVLYFPVAALFTEERLQNGLAMFASDPYTSIELKNQIKVIIIIVGMALVKIMKTTPVAGWSNG